MRRLTIKNPDNRTYRIACAQNTPELHVQISKLFDYPTLTGELVDIIGRMEDERPLSEWENLLKTKK